jgi:L-arabinokinase
VSPSTAPTSGAIVFYISGHGFGHATRAVEVINLLEPVLRSGGLEHTIVVRTAADPWLLDRALRVPAERMPAQVDTGIVQIDSLHLDEEATFAAAREFYSAFETRAREEADLLRALSARLVIADIPPLAFEAAHRAKVPSLGISNFTWDWIYEGYPEHAVHAGMVISTIRVAYRKATRALRLPMHGGFETFPVIDDIPFIARHAARSHDEVRTTLGIPADKPAVLASFGGYGVETLTDAPLDCLPDWTLVVSDRTMQARQPAASGRQNHTSIVHVNEDALYARGFRYEDLVAAVDVVLTKPGYGIVSECIANETALVYTSRGRFPEYDVFVREMPRYLRCAFISPEDLRAGRWIRALGAARTQPAPARTRTDGAEVAVKTILEMLAVSP